MPPVTQPLSPEAQAFVEKALVKLRAQGVTQDYCPRCSTSDWNVDLLAIPAISLPSGTGQPASGFLPAIRGAGGSVVAFQRSGYIPGLAIVCKNCGYIIFHNLNMLGIQVE